MSIILASLDYQLNTVHIVCDRMISIDGKPSQKELVKLFKIKGDLYYAVNGSIYNGLKLAALLKTQMIVL